MVEFYRNLWERRLGPLEALRQAQIAMIHRYDSRTRTLLDAETAVVRDGGKSHRASPALWASFLLSGDWR